MAGRIEPLKQGGEPSFPLASAQNRPYNSRVEDEISFGDGESNINPKNYQFVGFRPGFPLQASELNEIQEHYQMQLTLTINMMNNWITSGAGPMWRDGRLGYPGDGSMDGEAPPNTGFGVGGMPNGGVGHVEQFAISGPGWRGSTPLHPFESPYYGGVVDKQVSVVATTNNVSVTFNPGWWLVELPQTNPSTGDGREVSGLKHWIYLNESYNVPLINVSGNQDIEIPVGLVLQSVYYRCCESSDDPLNPCDPELGDNSANFANPVACGGSRYAVNIIGAGTVSESNWPANAGTSWSSSAQNQYNQLSLVCTINPSRRTVRYMNNIVIASGF
tara:strand:+ start:141 stop:1133 length:993 start_codon:yes stop_codon:yes gene_type:complete